MGVAEADHIRSFHVKQGHVRSNHVRSNHVMSEQIRSCHVRQGQISKGYLTIQRISGCWVVLIVSMKGGIQYVNYSIISLSRNPYFHRYSSRVVEGGTVSETKICKHCCILNSFHFYSALLSFHSSRLCFVPSTPSLSISTST